MPALLQRVESVRSFDASRFVALEVGGKRVGWIRRDLVARLHRWPNLLRVGEGIVQLASTDTVALAEVTRALLDEGAISGWRNETFPVRFRPDDAPLFHIERAAMRFFGLRSAAAHLNGFVRDAEGLKIWIARRSAAKSIDPGRLDSLVGGGIPSGQDAWQALLRECHEEAGIESALASQATAASALAVCHEVPEGLHSEILYPYDVELPDDFRPRNVDGEVSEFKLLGATEVADRVANGEFTCEAGLITLDFLVRRKAIAGPEIIDALDRCRARP